MRRRGEGAKDQAALVETDRKKARRQDPVAIIDKTGFHVLIDGTRHQISDGFGLRGIALQCIRADLERN